MTPSFEPLSSSMVRCRGEIAAIEAEIRAGNPDLQGLCLALSDWSGELRILQNEQRRRNLSTGGGKEQQRGRSGVERVGAFPVLSFRGFDVEPHLLPQRAADVATNGMSEPTRACHHFLQGCSARAFQQLQ